MPDTAQGDTPDLGDYRHWRPEAQERALDLLQRRQARPWKPFYCRKAACDGKPHGEWTHNHARADQKPPHWYSDWLTWFLSGGRGSGKTRTGSEVTHRATEMYGHMLFIAPTGTDFRDLMVEGESGLLVTANPSNNPVYEPSKKKLTWPNGCVGLGVSAEEPDRLRGKQSGYVWMDEPAHYEDPQTVWDMMMFGHRLPGKKGAQPKVVCTSTPKPVPWVKQRISDPSTVLTRVSSYANLDNLAESYRRNVLSKYEGTRLGKQELYGELLEDVEGALWTWDMFRWVAEAPELRRIVVGVDPAGTANKRSDATGIIVIGIGYDDVVYVLDDQTGRYSPGEWANRSIAAYEFWKADAIVVEKTYGRDMVTHTLQNSRLAKTVMPRIIAVDSRRGKEIRAEPVVALYEKGQPTEDGTPRPAKVVHVGERGTLADLEDEQTTWVPGPGSPSPNRVDALVHGVVELVKNVAPAEMASPVNIDYFTPPRMPGVIGPPTYNSSIFG